MGVLKALVESGKLTDESITTMLLRKTDWHHFEAIKWLLERGVPPNRTNVWGKTALQNAVLRDKYVGIIEVLLDHGADPAILGDTGHRRRGPLMSSGALAALRGRNDVLRRSVRTTRHSSRATRSRSSNCCVPARGDADGIRSITNREPGLVSQLMSEGGKLLGEIAGNGNIEGVRSLLEVGVDISALNTQGDVYFDVAADSTALHVAAWRARHEMVRFL